LVYDNWNNKRLVLKLLALSSCLNIIFNYLHFFLLIYFLIFCSVFILDTLIVHKLRWFNQISIFFIFTLLITLLEFFIFIFEFIKYFIQFLNNDFFPNFFIIRNMLVSAILLRLLFDKIISNSISESWLI
jgi:hypothetical protein